GQPRSRCTTAPSRTSWTGRPSVLPLTRTNSRPRSRTPPAPPDWRRRNSPRRSRPWPRWRPSTSRPSGRSRTGGRGSRGSRARSRRSRPGLRPPRRGAGGSAQDWRTGAAWSESSGAGTGRCDQERGNARSAVADAEAEFDSVYARVGALSEGERTLDDHLGRAERAHLDARARLTELRETERNADQEF